MAGGLKCTAVAMQRTECVSIGLHVIIMVSYMYW